MTLLSLVFKVIKRFKIFKMEMRHVMLINSKNKNDKIVRGLLSYTVDETVSALEQQQLLEMYQSQPEFDIFLYKEKESDNYIGIVIIERIQEVEYATMSIIIHRMSVLPSFRNEGVGYQMYCELRQMYPTASFQGSIIMSEFVKNWSIKYRLEMES